MIQLVLVLLAAITLSSAAALWQFRTAATHKQTIAQLEQDIEDNVRNMERLVMDTQYKEALAVKARQERRAALEQADAWRRRYEETAAQDALDLDAQRVPDDWIVFMRQPQSLSDGNGSGAASRSVSGGRPDAVSAEHRRGTP